MTLFLERSFNLPHVDSFAEDPCIDFSARYTLEDLLPYDASQKRKVNLKTELEEYQMILTATLRAIEALTQKDLIKFDGFVGENACQVRAIWVALIASGNLEHYTPIYHQIASSKAVIHHLLHSMSISQLHAKWTSLDDVLRSHDLIGQINFELYLLVQLFLLKEAKIPSETLSPVGSNLLPALYKSPKSAPKHLKQLGQVSTNFAEKLVRKSRRFVAAACVQFIREQAQKSSDKKLSNRLSSQFTVEHNDHLLCTPMFWTYQAVLSTAYEENIPIIIHAKFVKKEGEGYRIIGEDCLLFERETNPLCLRRLVLKEMEDTDTKRAALVVEGVVCLDSDEILSKKAWRELMVNYSIETALLAGTADHPQYPHSETRLFNEFNTDLEYHSYKSLAQTAGFSLDNPSTFFIQHVYSSQIQKFIKI